MTDTKKPKSKKARESKVLELNRWGSRAEVVIRGLRGGQEDEQRKQPAGSAYGETSNDV